MKKFVIVPLGICLFFIILSGFYLYRKYLVQVEAQKELMLWQASGTKTKFDVFNLRVSELPYIVMPFVGEKSMTEKDFINLNLYPGNMKRLEQFYLNNSHFIKGIYVNDTFGEVFDFYYDKDNNEFIKSTYKSRAINVLRSEIGVEIDKNSFFMILPIYHGNDLAGNAQVSIDVVSLFQEMFTPYLSKGDEWTTLVLDEETLYTLPLENEWKMTHEEGVVQGILLRNAGFLSGWIKNAKSSYRVVTYYESLKIPEYSLGIAFSGNISPFVSSYLWTFAFIFIFLVAVTVIALHTFHRMTVQNKDTIKKKEKEIQVLRTINQNIPVGLIVRRDNSFFAANDCLFALLEGYISATDIGRNMEELGFPTGFFKEHDQDESKEWDLCTFEKNGRELCLGRRQINMHMDGVKYSLDAFWDITELEQRIRSEITKSELLSRVSADVKKTLNNIRNAITLLEQQYPGEQHFEYINNLTGELSGFIDDVRDYADIEAGRIVLDEIPFNLIEEIKKVTDQYTLTAQQKGIELQTHVPSSINRNVVGDPQRFRQVLNELLSNALKFTNEGTIRVSIETKELHGRKTLVNCSVEDSGQGMSRQQLKDLFLLDLNAKDGQSIGLGVIIARKLVVMMGGNLRATSPSPISTNPEYPGTQFLFSINCYSDQPYYEKKLDFSSIVSYSQVNVLLIASESSQMLYLVNFMKSKKLHLDIYVYNQDSSDLLINKLIIDKGRYQMVIIAATTSEMTFAIADQIYQYNLTNDCLFVLTDTYCPRGHYRKAKAMNMDYYTTMSDDLSIYELILKTHFPNLSDRKDILIAPDLESKKLQILIGEDNELSQTVAKLIFKKIGLEVDLAQNALQLFKQLNEKTYDVIFIDLKFPPTDGFEVTEIIRQKGFKMPIIAMTSTLTKENIKHIADSGINEHVPKPLNPENVKNVLLKWFA